MVITILNTLTHSLEKSLQTTTFLLLLFFIYYFFEVDISFAKEKIPKDKFLASTLPVELIKEADAVVRYEKITFSSKNIQYSKLNIHQVVTILHANGRSLGELVLVYDKYIKIEELDGQIYDGEGNELRSLSKNDVKDYPATADISLYDDNRVKVAALYNDIYPYTIEFEYELTYRGSINWPSWYPEKERAAVEYSQFEVRLPKETQLRYWKNISNEPTIVTENNSSVYRWELSSLLPFEAEPVGPDVVDQLRCVKLAPEQFELEGYAGNFDTWKSFGTWYFTLQKNRQTLPAIVLQEVQNLTAGISNPKEKLQVLYEYFQSKTRYVSVQLGIGGWQPFDAKYVCERGYGDCKALTNYMMSLLNAVNIPSYPTLIHSSPLPRNFLSDFPSNQFNHVILFVPIGNDTVWLECTDQSIPFGHLGSNCENRYALVISSEGGTLIHTPSSLSANNSQARKAMVTIEGTGNATASIQEIFTGIQQDYVRSNLKDASPRDRENWLKEKISIPAFNLQSSNVSEMEKGEKDISIGMQLNMPRFASVAGSRFLFQPNLLERRTYVPRALEIRNHPVQHSYPYLNVDTIIYNIPKNCSVEAITKPVVIQTSFGMYYSAVTAIDTSTLVYIRHLELTATELPSEEYDNYRIFFQEVANADKTYISLVRK